MRNTVFSINCGPRVRAACTRRHPKPYAHPLRVPPAPFHRSTTPPHLKSVRLHGESGRRTWSLIARHAEPDGANSDTWSNLRLLGTLAVAQARPIGDRESKPTARRGMPVTAATSASDAVLLSPLPHCSGKEVSVHPGKSVQKYEDWPCGKYSRD